MNQQNYSPRCKVLKSPLWAKIWLPTIAILFHSFNLLAFSGAFTSSDPIIKSVLSSPLGTRHTPQSTFRKENIQRYLARSTEFLDQLIAHAHGPMNLAEHLSVQHQKDILNVFQGAPLPVPFHFEGYLLGVIDSDVGKLAIYRHLLTEASPASDLLLGVLSGRLSELKSTKALREALGEKTIINPELTLDQMREVFQRVPILVNFFHDFPGVINSILAFELNEIDRETFQTALTTNLFHNGPNMGFWSKLSNTLIPKAISKSQAQDITTQFLKNTVFEFHPKNFSITYPKSTSLEGFVHRIYDRISQGSRGGLLKIYAELHTHLTPEAKLREFLETTFPGTLLQLKALKTEVEHQNTSTANRLLLLRWIQAGQSYIENLKIYYEKTLLTNRAILEAAASGNDVLTARLLEQSLEDYEAKHSNPMRAFQ